MCKGKFIVLDGLEGSGKSTVLAMAKEHYGSKLTFTREPGGTPLSEMIRKLIFSEEGKDASILTTVLLFLASRAESFAKFTLPALLQGENVLADRGDSSTFAYNIYGIPEAEKLQLEDFFFKFRAMFFRDCFPDAYIFLDLTPEEGLARKKKQSDTDKNYNDEKPLSFHHRVSKGFVSFFRNPNLVGSKVFVINAFQSREKVWEDVQKAIDSVIG
jgi:dTMP kinase